MLPQELFATEGCSFSPAKHDASFARESEARFNSFAQSLGLLVEALPTVNRRCLCNFSVGNTAEVGGRLAAGGARELAGEPIRDSANIRFRN